MILLIDIGNTRLKWARLTPQGLSEQTSVAHNTANFDFNVLGSAATRVLFVSGVPSLSVALTAWVKTHWGIDAEQVQTQAVAHGVRNGYDEPTRLGADRWAALIGARALMRDPVCIVDCGTALTFNAMNAAGEFIGGAIMPGLSSARRCLSEVAPTLPAALEQTDAALARNTAGAIAAGILFGYAGAIERMVAEYRTLLGADMRVLITGGDRARLLPLLKISSESIDDLVLRGLAVVARERV